MNQNLKSDTQNPQKGALSKPVIIIGGGLAGCEAAWQISRRGIDAILYEMKPALFSPAHKSPLLAELVCSNSFRSDAVDSAVGLLKEEMRRLGSLIMAAADEDRFVLIDLTSGAVLDYLDLHRPLPCNPWR